MIVDVNVLVAYAAADHAHHRRASRWLDGALNGESRVGLPWHSLLGFVRIATHPRISTSPLRTAEAMDYVDAWLNAPAAWVPVPGARHAAILRRLLDATGTGGPLVPDAHLAALAIENYVPVVSFDSDFDALKVNRIEPPA